MDKVKIAVAFARSANQNQDKQKQSKSLDNQRSAIAKYANTNKFLIEAYFDNTVFEAQEILEGILGFCKGCPDIKYLLVKDISRISRNIDEFYVWESKFNKIGVKIISATEQRDDTPMGKFLESYFARFGQLYAGANSYRERREKIKERMLRKVEAGYSVHRPPFGYKTTDTKGLYEPDEAGIFLAHCFKAFADNKMTIADLRTELSKIRGENKAILPMNKIKIIVSNPYYSGTVIYDDIQFKGLHKPLMSKTAQAKLIKKISK